MTATPGRVIRRAVAERSAWRCVYCLRPLAEGAEHPADRPTVDHVVPRARGGTSRRRNLVAACRPCNGRKADSDLTEWLAACGLPGRLRSARTLAAYARSAGAGTAGAA